MWMRGLLAMRISILDYDDPDGWISATYLPSASRSRT